MHDYFRILSQSAHLHPVLRLCEEFCGDDGKLHSVFTRASRDYGE